MGSRMVAVIGAGIVGVSTAIWLLRAGHHVLLVDRKPPGEGASHGNAGLLASAAIVPVTTPGLLRAAPRMLLDPTQPLFLRWSYLPRLAPWLLRYLRHANAASAGRRAAALAPLIGDSLADHQALAAGTGAERWIVPSDYLFLYRDGAQMAGDAFAWSLRKAHGFVWDVLDAPALRAYDPVWGDAVSLAARLGNHGRIADPGRYVKDLAAHAEALGARFVRGEATDVARSDGAVTGVRVGGETLPCDAVVVATGAWSAPLARRLGLAVPLESERGYHIEFWEPSLVPRSPVMLVSGKCVVTPMDGRLRVAGTVEYGGLDAPPSRAPFALLERTIRTALPGLVWRERTEWMGHRPVIADSTPLIGPVPGIRGAFLGFGHDHVGLTGGPRTGRLLAQLVSGDRPNLDLSPFDPARFAA